MPQERGGGWGEGELLHTAISFLLLGGGCRKDAAGTEMPPESETSVVSAAGSRHCRESTLNSLRRLSA